jgi:CheY-like chemotaxis protein
MGGHVSARILAVGPNAEILVKDDGPGIAPGQLNSIFDLFVQGEQDSGRSLGGLGLGLSLVQQLVSLHGGSVSAFSTGRPGEGAEFLLQIPLVAAPRLLAGQSMDKHEDTRTVLVVDDNHDSADTLSMILESLGYQTVVAYGGAEALEAVKTRAFAAVLLDIGMPDFSGLQVADEVRRTLGKPPAMIAVSGYGQDSDRSSSQKAGFMAHLAKPVDVDALDQLLQQVLQGKPGGKPAGPRLA